MLLLGAALVAGVYLSVATFTSSTSGGASFSAGDLAFVLAPTGTIVNTSSMRPGNTQTGQVQITNQKSPGTYELAFGGIGSGTLAGVIQLTVAEVAPVSKQLYSGALSSVPTLQLGSIATGQTMQLSFTYAWSSSNTDPALQGQSIPLVLTWNART